MFSLISYYSELISYRNKILIVIVVTNAPINRHFVSCNSRWEIYPNRSIIYSVLSDSLYLQSDKVVSLISL